ALVTFHQFVKPALLKIMGCTYSGQLTLQAVLTKTVKKKQGRLEFVRAKLNSTLDGLTVTPVDGQESHMLGGLALANCLMHFPAEDSMLDAGTMVAVELLDWFGWLTTLTDPLQAALEYP
ncbi:MAG: hypothetical protein HY711_06305, partial [Candidatus Melainabacteria bacterium]|nr:hypothetical protein [Candidatus Melainabacteria bacterium]